jgi:dTDP-4-amino-4,6-dideoxygalactose transaminase
MNIQLMNIARQYNEHKEEFDSAIENTLVSGKYIGGEEVSNFEKSFASILGSKFCVTCGNGTDALILALRAIGIGPGDEVITVGFTFFATAESISSVGGIPVFVDVDKKSYCMDPSKIEEKITSRTKAILPVHIYGNVCDMDRIMAIAHKHNLLVVEDCAQATDCLYKGKAAGTFGDVGCFSFFPTKILGCAGDGGAIVTDNQIFADACRSYKVHGSGLDGLETMKREYSRKKLPLPASLSIGGDKYHNYLIGYNSRLDALQAALLNIKLKYLSNYIERRRANADYYYQHLTNKAIQLPYVSKEVRHGYYVFAVICDNSEEVMRILEDNGVEVHTYYPVPLHLQGAYASLNYKEGDLPVTEYLCRHSFAIPVYPEIEKEEMDFVIALLNKYAK